MKTFKRIRAEDEPDPGLNPVHLMRDYCENMFCGIPYSATFRHTADLNKTTCRDCLKAQEWFALGLLR